MTHRSQAWTATFVLFLVGGTWFVMHRYHFGEGIALAEKTASWIISENRDPSECDRIIVLSVFPGPSQDELRYDCYERVAIAKHDPSICMRFSTSSFFASCLGEVWGEMTIGGGCADYQNDSHFYCSSGKMYENIGVENCESYNAVEARDWCYAERSWLKPGVDDCTKISSKPDFLRWECQMLRARKEKKSYLCDLISNLSWKDLCTGWIEADKQ